MRRFLHLALATALTATFLSASAQKTVYGYTMLPSTSQTMISFTTDDPGTTSKMGSYHKAEPRSGAMVGSKLYMMGIDDDFNMWFYSIVAGQDGETIKKLGEVTCPGDMSYDYTTNTMYFIANSEETDGVSAIGTVNLENGKMQFTHDLPYYCKAIAVDSRGQMYVLANNGYLLKVNSSTGETQVIGQSGVSLASWWNFQSMEFDRVTGTLYLAAWCSDEKSKLYTVNTTTGKATLTGVIGNGNHVVALSIPFEPASTSAPQRVEDLTLTTDNNGALTATLTWKNPVNDYSGATLEGPISNEIVNCVTGEKVVLEHGVPGETVSYTFTVDNAGLYSFTVTAVNEAGSSLEQPVEGWIGPDVPGAVTDAMATLDRSQLLVNDLSWSAPVIGSHGGWLDTENIAYDVIRLNDGKVIAQNITDTHAQDTELLDELTRYSYQIVAKSPEGTGEAVKTNDLVNGPAVKCPYVAPFNTWEESGQYWTVLDANEDGYPFVWYKDYMNMFGQGGDKCFYIYQKSEVFYGYDFIISPPIEFQEGHEYKITANVKNDDIASYREEMFRFYTFAGYDMAGAVPLGNEPFTVKHPREFRDYSLTFTVEDDGQGAASEKFVGFIALCCCSQYDMGMLLVNRMSIEDITPVTPDFLIGDVNHDCEVNVADVNALIDMILSGKTELVGDINNDSEINIADVNTLIDIIMYK